MKRYYFYFFALLYASNVSCQPGSELDYALSTELIVRKAPGADQVEKSVNGIVNGKIVISGNTAGMTKTFLLFDENTQQVSPFITFQNKTEKVVSIIANEKRIIREGYMSVPDKYKDYPVEKIPVDSLPYQDIWIQQEKTNVKIDSYPFHYIDKYFKINFSHDGRYLVVNPYTDISAGYWPENDNRFYIYDLGNLKRIEKQTINCEQCMNANLVGDKIIFVKEIEIGGGRDGYYKNIYVAPKNNINDTLKIAHDINLVQISPDGKFILGQKYLYGEYTPVIIDVASRRFQYLLGREYPMSYSFYSPHQKKFAFDLGTHLVYISFPDTYPFDALNQKATRSSKTEDAAFWKKYQHQALK
jgi:hypothetical protein